MINQQFLVIALSARSYAEAAQRSGFCVSVIDGFLDQETLTVAQQAHVVAFDQHGFDSTSLKKTLATLNSADFLGCVYGSGVEGNSECLASIQEKMPLIGNTLDTVNKVRNPAAFFSTLENLSIAFPQIFSKLPKNHPHPILVKSAKGAGGQHIRFAEPNVQLKPHEYLQVHMEGEAVSVLFLVDQARAFKAHVIGFNLQWTAPSDTQPFRFGGIASHHALPEKTQRRLREAVQKITTAFALVGLNSLDVMICDEDIFVLEINPRLSASVALYAKALLEENQLDLISLHIQSGLGEPFSESSMQQLTQLPCQGTSNAMAVVYADQEMLINVADWPIWVKDKPANGQMFLKDTPICSVISQENTALLAKSLAETRVNFVKQALSERNVL